MNRKIACGSIVLALSLVVVFATTARASEPNVSEAAPTNQPLLTDSELRALCGGGVTSSIGVSLVEHEEDLVGLEKEFAEARKKIDSPKLTLNGCQQLADEIADSYLEAHRVKWRSLCDERLGDGTGDDLISQAPVTAAEIDAKSKEAKDATSVKECRKAVRALGESMDGWIAYSRGACRSAVDTTCGESAADDDVRKAAPTVCAAYRARTFVPKASAEIVSKCVRDKRRAAEATCSAKASGTCGAGGRGLDGDRALGAAALQTAILRGAADFFVDRAEKELSLFAAETVGARLCGKDSPAKTWLAHTCALLAPRESDQPVLGATPAAIREAARADLEELPAELARQLKGDQPELACAAAVAWSFTQEAVQGVELAELLSDLDPVLDDPLVKDLCSEPILGYIREVAAGVGKTRKAGGGNLPNLVRSADLDYLVSIAGAEMSDDTALSELGEVVKEVLRRTRELDAAIAALKQSPSPEARAAVVAAGLRTIQPIIAYAAKRSGKEKLARDLDIVVGVVTDVSNREYVAAVVKAAALLTSSKQIDERARNLIGLAATLAQADSSEAVRAAFEDAAMPLQSWRRKNERRFGITLTGMVGIQPAYELVIEDFDSGQEVSNGFSFAPALIVGIDMHRGLGRARLGLMLSVLDLGALVSIRFDDPVVEGDSAAKADAEPEIRFEQVFAPGGYLYFGAGPFDFGLGASFVPSLRPAENARGSEEMLNVWRIGVLLAVDVSVLPLL